MSFGKFIPTLKLTEEQFHALICDARYNPFKLCDIMLRDISSLLVASSHEIELLQEIVYDARQVRDFDYIEAAANAGLLEGKIIVPVSSDQELLKYVEPDWSKVSLPLGRRTFPELSAKDLVSVQNNYIYLPRMQGFMLCRRENTFL